MLPMNYVQSTLGGRVDGAPTVHDPRLRRSVFVGDLSFFCTEIDLANVFSRFGHVVTVEIKRGRHGDSLLHGFVEFDCDASAELAIQHMNGRKWMGRTLKANWTNISVTSNAEQDSWLQVHVNFTCKDLSRKVNEEFLEAIFVPFGGLADVTVKRHGCTGHPLQTTGYGFAYFKETFCALRAVHALRVIVVDGVRVECSLSRKAEATISQTMGVSSKLPFNAPAATQVNKAPSPPMNGMPSPYADNARKYLPSTQATYPPSTNTINSNNNMFENRQKIVSVNSVNNQAQTVFRMSKTSMNSTSNQQTYHQSSNNFEAERQMAFRQFQNQQMLARETFSHTNSEQQHGMMDSTTNTQMFRHNNNVSSNNVSTNSNLSDLARFRVSAATSSSDDATDSDNSGSHKGFQPTYNFTNEADFSSSFRFHATSAGDAANANPAFSSLTNPSYTLF